MYIYYLDSSLVILRIPALDQNTEINVPTPINGTEAPCKSVGKRCCHTPQNANGNANISTCIKITRTAETAYLASRPQMISSFGSVGVSSMNSASLLGKQPTTSSQLSAMQ